MARLSLNQMLGDLRAEIGASLNAAHTVNETEGWKYLLRRKQRQLYVDMDWPDLVADEIVEVPANARYVTSLNRVDFERINGVWSAYGTEWLPVEYGIGPEEYTVRNSLLGETDAPITRWRYDAVEGAVEVWPVPGAATKLYVRGVEALGPLTDGADMSTLDGTLIVLFVAAELLAKQRREDASLRLQEAQSYMNSLRRRLSGRKSPVTPLVPGETQRLRPGLDYIPRKG